MYTNVSAHPPLPVTLRNNTLPRVTIKDNPCSEDFLTLQQQEPHDLPPHISPSIQGLNDGQPANGLVYPTENNLLIDDPSSGHLQTVDPNQSQSCKRISVYLVLILLLLLVIINGASTIWIMAQINFSLDGMGSLTIDHHNLQLTGPAFFHQDLISSRIKSPKGKRMRIVSKTGTEVGVKDGDPDAIGSKLHLNNSTVIALANQLTIKSHQGKSLLTVDDSGLRLSSNRLAITGSEEVQLMGSIQTPSLQSSSLSISSSTRQILIKAINHVNLHSSNGLIAIQGLKTLALTSTGSKIYLNSSWIVLDNLKTVIASRSGKSYPEILSLCACPDGQFFLSPSNIHCIAHDNLC